MPDPVFQYPHTDRCPCNHLWCASRKQDQRSFSILTRIDAPVTLVYQVENNVKQLDFQYPHTDRCPCKQPGQSSTTTTQAFSILTRIDAPVTYREGLDLHTATHLSVSSHGSMPL